MSVSPLQPECLRERLRPQVGKQKSKTSQSHLGRIPLRSPPARGGLAPPCLGHHSAPCIWAVGMTQVHALTLRQRLAQALITNRMLLGAIGLNFAVGAFLLWLFGRA